MPLNACAPLPPAPESCRSASLGMMASWAPVGSVTCPIQQLGKPERSITCVYSAQKQVAPINPTVFSQLFHFPASLLRLSDNSLLKPCSRTGVIHSGNSTTSISFFTGEECWNLRRKVHKWSFWGFGVRLSQSKRKSLTLRVASIDRAKFLMSLREVHQSWIIFWGPACNKTIEAQLFQSFQTHLTAFI